MQAAGLVKMGLLIWTSPKAFFGSACGQDWMWQPVFCTQSALICKAFFEDQGQILKRYCRSSDLWQEIKLAVLWLSFDKDPTSTQLLYTFANVLL